MEFHQFMYLENLEKHQMSSLLNMHYFVARVKHIKYSGRKVQVTNTCIVENEWTL